MAEDIFGNSSIFAALAFGTDAFASIGGGVSQFISQRALGRLETSTAETNARISELQARDAIERGNEQIALLGKRGRALIGRTRTSFAAQGVQLGKGSAAEVEASNRAEINKDLTTIKNNAWLESFGFNFRAVQSRFQGKVAAITRKGAARSALISGSLKSASAIAKGISFSAGAFGKPSGSTPNVDSGFTTGLTDLSKNIDLRNVIL